MVHAAREELAYVALTSTASGFWRTDSSFRIAQKWIETRGRMRGQLGPIRDRAFGEEGRLRRTEREPMARTSERTKNYEGSTEDSVFSWIVVSTSDCAARILTVVGVMAAT